MPRNRVPRYQAEYVYQILKHLFASSRPTALLTAILLIVTLGVFTNSVTNLLSQITLREDYGGFDWKGDAVALVAFPVVVCGLLWGARNVRTDVRLRVITADPPVTARGLILFLSPPTSDGPLIDSLLKEEQRFDREQPFALRDPEFRSRWKGPWRMPLEAIAHHLERLERVVVIASRDLQKPDGGSFRGTWRRLSAFLWLVAAGLPPERRGTLKVSGLAELARDAGISPPAGENWEQGIDFESVEQLVDAVELGYQALESLRIPSYDVLVDLTGGQKPSTAAGAAVALAEGRRFQYVSTHDYHVRSYDVTYRS